MSSLLQNKKVIIVNDSATQADSIREYIQSDDIEAKTFTDTTESLEYLRKNQCPDLIIMDLHMPVIDGWRFCRLLRSPEFASYNSVPILITSAVYSGDDVEELSRDIGANAFLSMPSDSTQLRQIVDGLLSGTIRIQKPLALIVEDSPEVTYSISQALKKQGYETISAENEILAFELFSEHNPNVVLLDHHLPNITGLDIIQSLKTSNTKATFIIMTGDMSPDLCIEYMKLGADAFTRKPLSANKLIYEIDQTRRQRALLRIEDLLVERAQKSEEDYARLLQASKLAAVGEVATGIAHEINNPINGIINCADILNDEIETSAENHEFIKTIISEGRRVGRIVRRLVNFSRSDTKKEELTEASLPDLVESVLSMTQSRLRRSQVVVEQKISKNLPALYCRPTQIQQVILNLLINACDALDARYPSFDDNKIIIVEALQRQNNGTSEIVLNIEDHGCGINSKDKLYMLDPLFTTKEYGTGLGLSISHGIVKTHHGRIDIESEQNNYTRVSVCIPLTYQNQST